MFSKVPPAYDAKTAEDVSKQLPQLNEKIDFPSTSKRDKDVLSTEEDNGIIMKDIPSLASNVVKVNESFERVRKGLEDVDKTSDEWAPKFEENWQKLQIQWCGLLEESRSISERLDNYIRGTWLINVGSGRPLNLLKELLEVIIPLNETSSEKNIKDLKEKLATFVKHCPHIQAFSANQDPEPSIADFAKQLPQDFTNLQRDLHEFQDTFNRYTKKEEDIVQSLEEVKNAIEENAELITTLRRRYGTRNKLVESIRECELLYNRRVQLQALKNTMDTQDDDIKHIRTLSNSLAGIWSEVQHDANVIGSQLDTTVSSSKTRSASELNMSLDIVKKQYQRLRDALNGYHAQITKVRMQADDAEVESEKY